LRRNRGAATKLSLEFFLLNLKVCIQNSKVLACNVAACTSHLDALELSIFNFSIFGFNSLLILFHFHFLKIKLLLSLTVPLYEIGACFMTA
jgi:hypothetical protein